ncbi:hypothetical protein EV189_0994 [Motilibacter rhizosphaerae]|uniref:Uncharacterized protein n=1 Tax=Motilibacter rhizosphaerae TaxID=598652 RepID=A0A4Q7NX15_9ACTN|nr:hypothetical protein EV189_0994 [Motilibacter rhizosphaerae]
MRDVDLGALIASAVGLQWAFNYFTSIRWGPLGKRARLARRAEVTAHRSRARHPGPYAHPGEHPRLARAAERSRRGSGVVLVVLAGYWTARCTSSPLPLPAALGLGAALAVAGVALVLAPVPRWR